MTTFLKDFQTVLLACEKHAVSFKSVQQSFFLDEKGLQTHQMIASCTIDNNTAKGIKLCDFS